MHDIAQRSHGAGDDGDLLHRLGILLKCTDQGVTDLVVGDDLALLRAHDAVLFLLADQHLLDRGEEILLADEFSAFLDGIDGRLIDHIGQIGAHGAAGGQSDGIEIHALVKLYILRVNLQDLHTPLEVRLVHNDPAVETAGTEQCLIEDLGAVRRAEDQNTLGGVKAVHLAQKLVQCLLALFIAAAVFGITAATDGIDLIDEDDAGRVFIGFLEKVTDTACADTDVELDKIGTRQGEEGNMRFSGDGSREQRLTGSGRAHQKGTLRKSGTDPGVFSGIVQEVDHLHEGFLGFVLTGHILEGDAGILLHIDLRRALADAHGAASAAHTPHQEACEQPQQSHGQNHADQDLRKNTRRGGDHTIAGDTGRLETGGQRIHALHHIGGVGAVLLKRHVISILFQRILTGILLAGLRAVFEHRIQRQRDRQLRILRVECDGLHSPGLQIRQKLGVVLHHGRFVSAEEEIVEEEDEDHGTQNRQGHDPAARPAAVIAIALTAASVIVSRSASGPVPVSVRIVSVHLIVIHTLLHSITRTLTFIIKMEKTERKRKNFGFFYRSK